MTTEGKKVAKIILLQTEHFLKRSIIQYKIVAEKDFGDYFTQFFNHLKCILWL